MASIMGHHPSISQSNFASCSCFSGSGIRPLIFVALILLMGGGQVGFATESGRSHPGIEVCGYENPYTCTDMAQERTSVVNSPNIIARFGNPVFDCSTNKYCVEAQFQSDLANQRLFGMNVRFWYDHSYLSYVNFTGFETGYGAVAPNPPGGFSNEDIGSLWFNFDGGATYKNGAIQLTNESSPPIYISTTGWTKIFKICFDVVNAPDPDNFCPPILWDLEADPANGGYLSGSDGIVLTVVNPSGGTFPVFEHSDNFNWQHTGNGTAPYGEPIVEHCISVNCGPAITCPANVTVSCGASTDPSATGTATATGGCPGGNPTITYSDQTSGQACPQSNVITRTWVATDNCGNSSSCQQLINVVGTSCNRLVSTTANSGTGSLRDAIACSSDGDTITFSTALAGSTILLTTTRILINKTLYVRSNVTPKVKISSQVAGLFEIAAGKTVEFKDLEVTSGLSVTGNNGAAFNNNGILRLINMKVLKNASLPTGEYLIRNKPSSQFNLHGNCFIEVP